MTNDEYDLKIAALEARLFSAGMLYPQRYVDGLDKEIATLRGKVEEYREGWAQCAVNAAAAHDLNRRLREFMHAYFVCGVMRYGERDGKLWTYREEARELLGPILPDVKQPPDPERAAGVALKPCEQAGERSTTDLKLSDGGAWRGSCDGGAKDSIRATEKGGPK